jgi:hypothetical protein
MCYIQEMKTYTGGCHCGAVKFEVKADFMKAMVCNCSHCHMKGFLLAFVPAEDFTLLQGEENLTEYRFNKKKIAHLFCKTCGVQAFGRGEKKDGTPTVMVNLRCVDGIDTDTLEITKVNGKDF